MTRWCINSLQLTGNDEQKTKAYGMFTELAQRQQREQQPVLPVCCDPSRGGHFFNLDIEGQDISYRTRWMTNLAELIDLADHYNLGFILRYHGVEFNCYGLARYENGEFEENSLGYGDFMSYTLNARKTAYMFEGTEYKDQGDIHEILLARKIHRTEFASLAAKDLKAGLSKKEMKNRIYFHSALLTDVLIEKLFVDMHHFASTTNGDIDPMQAQELDEIKLELAGLKARLSQLLAIQTWQNTEQFNNKD